MSSWKKLSPLDVLAFGPHPDDVEISCGGTIARLTSLGYKVGIVDLTEGELSTRGDVKTRRKEAQNAARVLKLSHRSNLSLPDGSISLDDSQVYKVVECIRKLRPTIVLLPPAEERHPDHTAGHNLIKKALFLSGLGKFHTGKFEKFTASYLLTYQMRYETNFSFLVDISDVFDIKLRSIKCYESQVFTGKNGKYSSEQSFISTEDAFRAFCTPTAFYGSMIGVEHAEPLTYIGTLGITDPFDFLINQTVGNQKNQYIYRTHR